MKELIEMQSFNRSQVDQSRLFSLDYETVSEPAVPLIHQESRFLFALDGAGKIVIQGKEYDFRRGTLVSILPWQVSEISAVEKPVQYVIIRYHFDTVQNVIHLFSDVSGDPCSSLTRIEDHAAVQLSEDKIADVRNIVQLIREEIGIESSKNLHAEKELENIAVLGADTDSSPYDSGSYASSTTYVTGKAVEKCALELKDKICTLGAQLLGLDKAAVLFTGDAVTSTTMISPVENPRRIST